MFWDKVAGVYDIYVNVINRKTHQKLKVIVASYIEPKDNVLECACGTGMLTRVIAQRCSSLTATDFAPKMLAKAEENCASYPNIEFMQADITALPFEDNTFDKVVAANVIHLLDQPLTALKELDRVCKPGGLLIIPTYMNRKENPNAFISTLNDAGADFKREFDLNTYQQFFLDEGYSDVKILHAEGFIPCAVAIMKKKETA